MPLSGVVLEFNSNLEETPETVNEEPYELGWIIKIKIDSPTQIKNLMSADQYMHLIQV